MKPSTRPYHHGNLRQALLRAAEAALEARGIQQLSLRELSRELGVSHASPQRHFPSKQDLIDALAITGFERLSAAVARAVVCAVLASIQDTIFVSVQPLAASTRPITTPIIMSMWFSG